MNDLLPMARRGLLAAALAATILVPGVALAAGDILGPVTATADKPQSKVWYNDGYYWAILESSDGSHFFKLVSGTWIEEEFVDSRIDHGIEGHEDVLWNGTELFVMVYSSRPRLYKYTYDATLDVYNLLPGFPVSLTIPSGSETIVIDQDSSGRLWAAYEAGGDIYAAYTTSADHLSWQTPGVVLRSGVADDDVAAIVRFATNRVGVFWSDQNRWEFGFRYHVATNPPETWSSVEIIYAGDGHSDDHLNLAADRSGRVYAITKDANDEFAAHRRDTDGDWTSRGNITGGENGTRPVLMLDDGETKLYALYTCWDCGSNDPIRYRVGSTSTLSFGSGTTFISTSTGSLNDVTDMKQILPPGSMLAIAHDSGRAYWNGWGTPPAGNGFGGSSTPSEPPPPPPPPPPPGPPTGLVIAQAALHPTPGVAASFLFDETEGTTVLNDAGASGHAQLGPDTKAPLRVAGRVNGALSFDGSGDYAEAPDSPALGFDGSFTVEAWVRHPLGGSPDVIVSKEGSGRNYRLRITSGDRLELAWKSASGSSRATLGSRTIVDENWHHVAAVRDYERGEDRLYIDGVLDARRSDSARPGLCTDPLLIGARLSSGSRAEFFRGDIDMVRLSSRVQYDADFTPPAEYPTGPAQPYALLAWEAPQTGGTASGYTVYRSTNAEDEIAITPAVTPSTSWIDMGAVDGILAYRVSASNSMGEGPKSEGATIVFGNGPTPPEPPSQPIVRIVHRLEPLQGNAIYPMDEGAGSTSADASGNNFELQLGSSAIGGSSEPEWIDGPSGSALRFNGSAQHASTPDDPRLSFDASFTVEAWIRLPQTGKYGIIVAKESSSAGRNYRFAVTAGGKLELQWKNLSGGTNLVSSAVPLTIGEWHHVAGVFDRDAAENRLFVDGEFAGRAAATGTPQIAATSFRIGARLSSSSLRDYFLGDIDLVRVTPRALYRESFAPPRAYAPRNVAEHVIEWQPAAPGSARIAGYELERCIADGAWVGLMGAPIAATTMTLEEASRAQACYRVVAVDRLGLRSRSSVNRCVYGKEPQQVALSKTAPPAEFSVSAGPNPFNPATTIRLRLDRERQVEARIYDVGGRVVATLARGVLPAGEHRFTWAGHGPDGAPVASGVYFLRVQAGDETRKMKLVLAK